MYISLHLPSTSSRVVSVCADHVYDAVGGDGRAGPAGGHARPAVAGVLCADPAVAGLTGSDVETFLTHRPVRLPALVARKDSTCHQIEIRIIRPTRPQMRGRVSLQRAPGRLRHSRRECWPSECPRPRQPWRGRAGRQWSSSRPRPCRHP